MIGCGEFQGQKKVVVGWIGISRGVAGAITARDVILTRCARQAAKLATWGNPQGAALPGSLGSELQGTTADYRALWMGCTGCGSVFT